MRSSKTACLILGWAMLLVLIQTGSVLSATPDEDVRPIKTGQTITGLVEDDYTDGLLVTTDAGVTYVVLTPESVSLAQEEAFHKLHKGKRVTLTGDIYKDEDGTLSLFIKELPHQ